MADPYFFGYGSLVNLDTDDFPDPQRAKARGWRREWRHTDLREVAFLTAVRDTTAEIEGMIAHVPDDDWAALDQREWAYDRVPATQAVDHPLQRPVEIAIYAVPQDRFSDQADQHPILMSYLDVVVQGYLRSFGDEGVARFFASTTGWTLPVLDDRAAPRYPRHQVLSQGERSLVDQRLAEVGAQVVGLTDWHPKTEG